jgi:FKBP-type peptidyl-prolyl cis-trans isomerase FklB
MGVYPKTINMKNKYVLLTVAIAFATSSCSTMQSTSSVTPAQLKTAKDSVSYVLGVSMAENLQKQGLSQMNKDIVNSAFNATIEGKESFMDVETRDAILKKHFSNLQSLLTEEAKATETAFLTANKKKPGVNELPSGLQYKILKKGTGTETPTTSSKVSVHYTGKLTNGTVFDSSVERGQPATFGVTQVIKGWTEALQLMHVGDKFELYLPSKLAYGSREVGKYIKPNSLLIFEVELLEIK